MTFLIEPIKIKQGQKIAQLIVSNIMYPEIKVVKSLKSTGRNGKGFGEIKFTFYNILFDLIVPTNPLKYYLI